MNVEIKPHRYEEYGHKMFAECYPFINGKPAPSIAGCEYCSLNKSDDEEICSGWKDNPGDAPLFCGPVCPKFKLRKREQSIFDDI